MLKAPKQYAIERGHNFDIFGGHSAGGEFVKLILQSYCAAGFHTVRLPVYVCEAIVAAIELDFIFQQQPLPPYRSFHFDASYNSFTVTQEESQQPVTPTCSRLTSALPQTLSPSCFILYSNLVKQITTNDDKKQQQFREKCSSTWELIKKIS